MKIDVFLAHCNLSHNRDNMHVLHTIHCEREMNELTAMYIIPYDSTVFTSNLPTRDVL